MVSMDGSKEINAYIRLCESMVDFWRAWATSMYLLPLMGNYFNN
jgi:hypothetical protein